MAKLDIVDLDEVNVINPKSAETFVQTTESSGCREIEVLDVRPITRNFGCQKVLVARYMTQGFAKDGLCGSSPDSREPYRLD